MQSRVTTGVGGSDNHEAASSIDDRGSTEPLAALVSVAAICVAISVYAGFASVTLSHTTDDPAVDRATLDTVWATVSEDGIVESTTSLEIAIPPEALPRGYYVQVRITRVGDSGHLVTVGEAVFDDRGQFVETKIDPPPDGTAAERPVPVRIRDGDVRPGRLTVEVWDG